MQQKITHLQNIIGIGITINLKDKSAVHRVVANVASSGLVSLDCRPLLLLNTSPDVCS